MSLPIIQTLYNEAAFIAAKNAINNALDCVLPDLKVAKWTACGPTGWVKFSKADPNLKIETRVTTRTKSEDEYKVDYAIFVNYAGVSVYDSGPSTKLVQVIDAFAKWCISKHGRSFPSIARMVVEEYEPKVSNASLGNGDIINIRARSYILGDKVWLNNDGHGDMRILVDAAPSQSELLSEDPNTGGGLLKVLTPGDSTGRNAPSLRGCGLTWMHILSHPFTITRKNTVISIDAVTTPKMKKPDFLPPNGSVEVRAPWPNLNKPKRETIPPTALVDPKPVKLLGKTDQDTRDAKEERLKDDYRALRQAYLMCAHGGSHNTAKMTLIDMDKIWMQLSVANRWLVAHA